MTTAPAASSGPDPITVAIDASPLLAPMTGVGAAVQQLIAALARDGHATVVPFACSFRGHLQTGMRRLPLPAAVAHRLWARMPGPRLDRWVRPAQVIHGTNYVVGPSRLPRVVSVYDCWFLRHPDQASESVNRAGRVLRRAVATGATVHASSAATADAVRELLATDQVVVIPLAALPIDPVDAIKPLVASLSPIAELNGAPYIVALGTLERRKNLPRLIEAFDAVAAADSDVRLVIAGSDGDDRDAIDAAIDAVSARARARIVLTGRVDQQAKSWLLANARVLAYPSLEEGFGFPLLEAMQRDVPVVASTAGSIPEVAGDAAILVSPHDAGELASALQTALGDTVARDRLVGAGRIRLSAFSWQSTAQSLIGLYRRLDEQGPA